jgi:hypothetical protein
MIFRVIPFFPDFFCGKQKKLNSMEEILDRALKSAKRSHEMLKDLDIQLKAMEDRMNGLPPVKMRATHIKLIRYAVDDNGIRLKDKPFNLFLLEHMIEDCNTGEDLLKFAHAESHKIFGWELDLHRIARGSEFEVRFAIEGQRPVSSRTFQKMKKECILRVPRRRMQLNLMSIEVVLTRRSSRG